jgi:hypothetical protein
VRGSDAPLRPKVPFNRTPDPRPRWRGTVEQHRPSYRNYASGTALIAGAVFGALRINAAA